MCSNIEATDLPPSNCNISLDKLRKCKRCDQNSFVCLQKKDVFCQKCFYEYCSHKFRATIGKSRLVKPKDSILIAFSGGASSVAMLDMTMDGLHNPDIHRKLLFSPALLFVSELPYQSDEKTFRAYQQRVLEIMLKSGLRCFVSSLEMFFTSSHSFYQQLDKESPNIPSCSIARQKLRSKLDLFESLTAQEDFIRIIRLQLIQKIALQEKFRFIFSGETCTRTAILTLADTAQGKGSQIVAQQAFCDERFHVRILRPLREFVKKEVVFWNCMRGNSPVENTNLTTKMNFKASIQKLTESYVYGLEKNFPATVYTIFRTGNKLSQPTGDGERCFFCKSIKDDVSFCSAFTALQLSHCISKNLSVNNCDERKSERPLCYSCSVLLSEMDNGVARVKRDLTQADIAEYLL